MIFHNQHDLSIEKPAAGLTSRSGQHQALKAMDFEGSVKLMEVSLTK